MIPFAALARVAAAGGVSAGEAAAARSAVGARSMAWRQAYEASGGNKRVAREAIQQKASDLREQERQQRRQAQDEAREQARAYQQQEQQLAQVRRNVGRQAASQMPGLASGMFSNPHATMANAGTSVITDNYAGLAASALPGKMGEALMAVSRLTDAVNARARELAPYSGAISGAEARSDVRGIRADIYETKVAGKSYSRVVDESSKLETGLQTAFAPLKDEIAKALADLLQFLNRFMPEFQALALFLRDSWLVAKNIMEGGFYAMILAMQGQFDDAFNAYKEGLRGAELDVGVAHKQDKIRDSQGIDPFQSWWDDPLLQLPGEAPVAPPAGDRRLGFDFFGV